MAVVVDRTFGHHLAPLANTVHVWACDSTANRTAAQGIWATLGEYSPERGVTIFKVAPSDTPEEMLLDVLDTLDLHHNEYSHDPPWSCLIVHGTMLSDGIRAALTAFGVTTFDGTESGFKACRPIDLD